MGLWHYLEGVNASVEYDVVRELPSPLWHCFCEYSNPGEVEHRVSRFLWQAKVWDMDELLLEGWCKALVKHVAAGRRCVCRLAVQKGDGE